MKTSDLLRLLEENHEKALLFEYAPNLLVGANYHITEVKHVKIDSVDCGAGRDSWNETIIQLWESPTELGKTKFMNAAKALGILKKVGEIKQYDLEAEVKFEYANATFHTAQLYVISFEIKNDNLLLKLDIEPTDCKAKEACGVPETARDIEKASACAPGSGCC